MKVGSVGTQAQPRVKIKPAGLADLAWVLFLGILLVGLVLVGELYSASAKYLAPLRIPLGVLYVLLAPGYLLQSTVFPRKADLEDIERLGLSLGLSIGLIPLLALLLDHLPWGLRLWPIVLGQASLMMLLALAAIFRRLLIPAGEAYAPRLSLSPRIWWHSLERGNQRLIIISGIALLLAIFATAWIFLVPSRADFMTEFYMLGQGGLAEEYQREIFAGDTVTVTLGITNREGTASTYTVQVFLCNMVIGQAGPITLEDKDTWEQKVEFTLPEIGDDQQVTFELNRGGQPSPYRTLRLWIDVKPAKSP